MHRKDTGFMSAMRVSFAMRLSHEAEDVEIYGDSVSLHMIPS